MSKLTIIVYINTDFKPPYNVYWKNKVIYNVWTYLCISGTNRVSHAILGAHDGGIFSVCVMKDSTILTGGKDRRIVKWDSNYKRTGVEHEVNRMVSFLIYMFCAIRTMLKCQIKIFTHLKLCLATATHNFKWVEITHNCLIWNKTFTNLDVWT